MLTLLQKYFGYAQFRPLQEEVIQHVITGKDALVLMPTGGGKSLCFQLPALHLPGLTLVISPLIALMKDQVDALRANGVAAAFMNSSLSAEESRSVLRAAQSGDLKLLYIAPERLSIPQFRMYLQSLRISLLAIDEAHCISEWGHDFRPEYRNLVVLRQEFPGVPLIALTATANDRVRKDICVQLKLEQARLFLSSFDRPNLTYRVTPKKKSFALLLNLLRQHANEPTIIYCFSRQATEDLAADLRAHQINAGAYHAGLDPRTRQMAQEQFMRDEVPIIVATIAFGMGIDKPDIRLIVHMDMPKSVEGYYQETGRAGRDGLPSECVLFYTPGARIKHEYFIRQMSDVAERQRIREQLQYMMRFCEATHCRRAYLLSYFSETYEKPSCAACDICAPTRAVSIEQAVASVEGYDAELFEALRRVRKQLAEEGRVPPYVICGDRTLQEMARFYPQSKTSLSHIFGIGREKLVRYGELFLQAIVGHATQYGHADQVPMDVSAPARSSSRVDDAKHVIVRASSTYAETRELMKQRLSLEEMAKRRGVVPGTIVGHLEKLISADEVIEFDHLLPPADRSMQIEHAFKQTQGWMLNPVKQRLGASFSYEEIRLVRLALQRNVKTQ